MYFKLCSASFTNNLHRVRYNCRAEVLLNVPRDNIAEIIKRVTGKGIYRRILIKFTQVQGQINAFIMLILDLVS